MKEHEGALLMQTIVGNTFPFYSVFLYTTVREKMVPDEIEQLLPSLS